MLKMQKMDVLVSLYIFCILVAELMGGKTVPLFQIGTLNLSVSVAIFVLPLIFTINDVITEVHGKERARSVIQAGLLMIGLVLGFILLATALPPTTRFAPTEAAYDTVFALSARISAASLTAFVLAEVVDVLVFVRLRQKLGSSALWLRNNLSNFVSQFFDTSVFMVLAFYRPSESLFENGGFLLGLILPYWLLKCSVSVLQTPLVYLGVKWLKGAQRN
jgi:uncharacterized integral membrane protein (TIGR00697 family)